MDTTDVLEFLRQSNNIEGIYDDDALMQAWHAWDYLRHQAWLTIGAVCRTHAILMAHQPLAPREIGRFRERAVSIGGHPGRPWYAVPDLMEAWVARANRSNDWQADHVLYEQIHPFIDGNGRTGRMFLNWQRLHCGLPILIIRADERDDYYRWFQAA